MPFKIPFTNVVVTGHRGTALTHRKDHPLVRALAGQPKDALEAAYRDQPQLRPPPKLRGNLPRVSLKRATDYTRLVDDRAVRQAAGRTTVVVNNPAEVLGAVTTHIQRQLGRIEARQGRRSTAPLILVGDVHGTMASLLVSLSAVASIPGARPMVLFEIARDDVPVVANMVRELDRTLAAGVDAAEATIRGWLAQPDWHERTCHTVVLTALAAAKLGGRIGHFDPKHDDAHDQGDREQAMVATVRGVMAQADGPVIVVTGHSHLPKLNDGLGGLFDTVALTTIYGDTANPSSSDERKRSSYLFSRPDILKLRHRTENLDALDSTENFPVDALDFMRRVVDLAKPLPPVLEVSQGVAAGQPFGIPGSSRS